MAIAAHELAHAWWSNAPSQSLHNFLNESFAEYFACLALERIFGEDAFAASLERARSLSEDAGSIRDWTPRSNHALVYGKGPLLLHELRGRVGDEAFFELMRAAYRERVDQIPLFIDLVEETSDADSAEWLAQAL